MRALLAIFTVLLAGPIQVQKAIDVYLIGGQSNATGQGYVANIPECFTIDTDVQLFYSNYLRGGGKNMEWGPLCQASESKDRFGAELSMGTALHRYFPDRNIALIKHGLSGANLYHQWKPGAHPEDVENFGPEFQKFIATVNKGLEDLRAMGYEPTIRGMAWQQGEADARFNAGAENTDNYGENLRHFVKRVREQFHTPEMLFVYGYVIPVPLERFTGRDKVRLAQRHLDENSGQALALEGAHVVYTNDLPLRCDEPNSPYPNDKVHFNTFGMLALGERYAQAFAEHLPKK